MSSLTKQSGTYLTSDVTLLLDIVKRSEIDHVAVEQKEALIQSGARHYSDMLTLEQLPSKAHERMYQQALQQGRGRMAKDICALCTSLQAIFADKVAQDIPIILVSLVRAGLPIGVLLQRTCHDMAITSQHYGVSIIRDRRLDPVALEYLLMAHPDSPIVFVDGWTGKGAIYGELSRSLQRFNSPDNAHFSQIFHQGDGVIPLLTLADPAGVAWMSASTQDWLIPSGLLGCTVSGLISRTLYSDNNGNASETNTTISAYPKGLHKSIIYSEFKTFDHSLKFVDTIMQAISDLKGQQDNDRLATFDAPRYRTQPIIAMLAERYGVQNINRIKPTIAEATRAVMRRDPERVLLAQAAHPDTELLRHLCQQNRITLEVLGEDILPYQAVTIIKKRH